MAWRFRKHYTLAEARALLPQLRLWLGQLQRLRRDLASYEQSTEPHLVQGDDFGGGKVNQWIRNLSAFKEVLEEFNQREIQIKDLDRGLVDFPAIQANREVFLCWEQHEDDITYWHDLETGYGGREKL